jgi:hypothetical protein
VESHLRKGRDLRQDQEPMATGCIAAHLCKRSKGGAASVVVAAAKVGQPAFISEFVARNSRFLHCAVAFAPAAVGMTRCKVSQSLMAIRLKDRLASRMVITIVCRGLKS